GHGHPAGGHVRTGHPRRDPAVQRRTVELPARRRAAGPRRPARRRGPPGHGPGTRTVRARFVGTRQRHRAGDPVRKGERIQVTDQPRFTIRVDQNKYLPVGGTEVHAILTVESSGPAEGAAPTAQAAEVIIIDTSGSMAHGKIHEARKAAQAAVDTLRDGVHFAIVAGTARARMVYPQEHRLVPADPQTRQAAKDAISRLEADGGTAMGRWLRLAADLFAPLPGAIKHAILLTDGKNEHQSAEEFDADLAYCTGKFVCDCRGVGDAWVV